MTLIRESGSPERGEPPTVTAQRPGHTLGPPTQPQCFHRAAHRPPAVLSTQPPSVLPASPLGWGWAHRHELARLLPVCTLARSRSGPVAGRWCRMVGESNMPPFVPLGWQARCPHRAPRWTQPGSSRSCAASGVGCCRLVTPHSRASAEALALRS